jgi:hypothetical protein
MLTFSLSIVGMCHHTKVPTQILKTYRFFDFRLFFFAHLPVIVLPQPCPLPEDHHRKHTAAHPEGDFEYPEHSELHIPTNLHHLKIPACFRVASPCRRLWKRKKKPAFSCASECLGGHEHIEMQRIMSI